LVQGLTHALAWLVAWPAAVWSAAVAPWWAQVAALGGAALLVAPLPWRLRALALPLMLPLLRALGVARLDMLMLSHRDIDHVGGAASLLSVLPVGELRSSLEATHPLLAAAKMHRRCEAGQSWTWDGVRFAVLHPSPDDFDRPQPKPNTLSCVLSVNEAQGRRVLLTGDLEAEQEARLVRDQPEAVRADILLVPHHGSKTSSSPAFLDAVAPRVAVVQAGYRNRFGHPAAEVKARYAERGIDWVSTVDCGAWSAEASSSTCERRARRRYWHWPGAVP
jgi:competence protein ComEC